MDLLFERCKKTAKTNPNKVVIISGEKQTTYGQLIDEVMKAVNFLKSEDVYPSDKVVFSAPSKAEYVELYLAIQAVGAISVPLLKSIGIEEARYICEETEAKLVVSDNRKFSELPGWKSYKDIFSIDSSDFVDVDSFVIPDRNEEDIAEILYTSGTTGKPKGVMLSNRAICASIKNTMNGMEMQEDDVLLLPLPLNHSFGMRVLRAALFTGESICLQNGFSFAKEFLDNIEINKCNCLACVSSGFEMLRQQIGERLFLYISKLRYVEFSAGAASEELRKELSGKCPDVQIFNTWGSSETGGALFINTTLRKDKIWSAGAPINDIEIAILDDKYNFLSKDGDSIGRLALRGPMLLSGYYNSELTKNTLVDGWFVTNDLVSIDEEDYVKLRGRADDIISVGGEKVAPLDVERFVLEASEVFEAVCVGVDDPNKLLGQVPVVFVVGKIGDRKQIEALIRTNGNPFMMPYDYVEVNQIPRNYMGKVDRKELKKLWEQKLSFGNTATKEKENAKKMLQLILSRRSVRQFTDKCIEHEKLKDILEAARYAPSGHNMQTWKFTVIRSSEEIARFKEVIETVVARTKTPYYGFLNPSTIIIVTNDRRNAYGIQDSSAAIQNMQLMAHAHGLGAVWLNSCLKISDEPEIREMLDKYNIKKSHVVHGIVGLGYYVNAPKTPVKKENVIEYYD